MRIDLYEEQPDVGGNRHYDYITVEEHDVAEKSLETKERYKDLTSHEFVVLRHKARQVGLIKDIVDHADRLALLRCLFAHCENRDKWYELSKKFEHQLQNLVEYIDTLGLAENDTIKAARETLEGNL